MSCFGARGKGKAARMPRLRKALTGSEKRKLADEDAAAQAWAGRFENRHGERRIAGSPLAPHGRGWRW